MSFFKTSFLSLIATSVKILAGLVVNKFISFHVGPGGLAVVGQFQNFIQISQSIGRGGINSGVTRFVSQYRSGAPENLNKLLGTAFAISAVFSFIASMTILLFNKFWAVKILNDDSYAPYFVVLGIFLFFFVINNLILSVLNGLKQIRYFIAINIVQSLCSLAFTSLMIFKWGINGALIAITTNQSIVFIVAILLLKRFNVFDFWPFFHRADKFVARGLFKYSAMAITSATIVPMSHMMIRNYLSEQISTEAAGYWQGIWYISSTYLMLVTTTLSTYYLPRLAETSNRDELRSEIRLGYKRVLPILIVASLIIYISRNLIIKLLFTNSFESMEPLFLFQLVGDVIKISSWLIGMLLSVKGLMKSHILTEIFFSCSFVLLVMKLVDRFGLVGATYAYSINYVLHFIVMYLIVKKLRVI